MSNRSRWMLSAAAVVLLTLAAQPVESAPTTTHDLLDVRVEPAGSGVVVRLATSGDVPFESFLVDGPDRLVIDMPGVVNHVEQYAVAVERAGVARVRAAQHASEPAPITRVVFDLERPLAYRIEPVAGGYDVVFGEATRRAAAVEPVRQPPAAAAIPAPTGSLDDLVRELESRLPATEPVAEPVAAATAEPDLIDRLLDAAPPAAPSLAAPQADADYGSMGGRTAIGGEQVEYTGKRISLNLVDADIKQVFRLFHEISGLNFVLDPSVSGRVTIVLDQVPWDQALDIILRNNGLDKVLENNVIRIATTTKLAQEAAARKQLKEAEELEVELMTITRALSYAKAAELENIFRAGGTGTQGGLLSPRGRVIVDERTNTVIVTDIPKRVRSIDALISTLDAETPQVMIEARIVETSRDYTQDLGVTWGFEGKADASTGTSTGLSFPHNASVKYGLNLPGENEASRLAFRFGNVIDSFTLDVALNTLETQGYGRILSSPKIATQNNERAEIEQGVRIPIVNTTATEINVEFVSASLKMVVTPQITAEGTIILDVEVENNAPDFVNTAGGIPSINTQRAQTTVLISDGGTTVIGGIFTVNEGRSEQGVPWFRKLPVFGWLFKSQNITNRNRELLIFITPKIMRVA